MPQLLVSSYDPGEGHLRKLEHRRACLSVALDPIAFRCPFLPQPGGGLPGHRSPAIRRAFLEENLNFGSWGSTKLTQDQKNVLIFGGLALGFAFFCRLYSLR